jgi:tetratricopeptide (TPR) repeat protein
MISTFILLTLAFIAIYSVIYVQKNLRKDKYNKLINKNDFKGFFNLSKLYLGEKRYQSAIEIIDKWLEENPYHLRALATKAFIYYFKGDYKRSSEIVNKGLNIDPEYSEFLYIAGELEMEKGNKELGKELKNRAYKKNNNLKVISMRDLPFRRKVDRYIEYYK